MALVKLPGGGIYITKSKGKDGVYYNGSVGKGFGYGAQKGHYTCKGTLMLALAFAFLVQNMIIGGRITKPLRERARKYRGIPILKVLLLNI